MKKIAILIILTSCVSMVQAQNNWSTLGQSNNNNRLYDNQEQRFNNRLSAEDNYNGRFSNQQKPLSGLPIAVNDADLHKQLIGVLGTYPEYKGVTLSVNGGNVTATGNVATEAHRDSLGALLGSNSNVRSINNHVTVTERRDRSDEAGIVEPFAPWPNK